MGSQTQISDTEFPDQASSSESGSALESVSRVVADFSTPILIPIPTPIYYRSHRVEVFAE